MGACLSLCGKNSAGPDAEIYRQATRPTAPDTPNDIAARQRAADAAAQRQQAYEQSAAGRAAMKSVRAVKEERQQGRAPAGGVTAQDWVN